MFLLFFLFCVLKCVSYPLETVLGRILGIVSPLFLNEKKYERNLEQMSVVKSYKEVTVWLPYAPCCPPA